MAIPDLRSRGRVRRPFLPLMLLVSSAASGHDGLPAPPIPEQLAGTWVTPEETVYRSYSACCTGPGTEVPFTPKYRKLRDAFASIPENTPQKTVGNLSKCISPGVPGTFEHPLLFEVLLTPGRVNLIFNDGSFRRIWTDGRTFPESLPPTPQGYSIGRWQGTTLTIETRGISKQSELFIEGPLRVTGKTRVTEEITIESDQAMHMRTTVEDASIFTRPYAYDTKFIKVPATFEVGCAADNRDDAQKPVDLTLPDDDA